MKHVKLESYNDEEWIIPLSQPAEQRINELIKQHKIISLKINKKYKKIIKELLKNGKKE